MLLIDAIYKIKVNFNRLESISCQIFIFVKISILEAAAFLKIFENHPLAENAIGLLKSTPGSKLHLKGLLGASKSIWTGILFRKLRHHFIVILDDWEEASYFYDDLNNLGLGDKILFFPASVKKSGPHAIQEQENILLRTEVLNRLSEKKEKYIITTYPEAVAEKVISHEKLEQSTLNLSVGEKVSIGFINEFLQEYGFVRVDFVYEPGQISVRGSIVDIFSYSSDDPYRIDFFGDEVESIRSFNADTQLSKDFFNTISIVPNIQADQDVKNLIAFPDFLPEGCVIAGSNFRQAMDQVTATFNLNLVNEKNPDSETMISGSVLMQKLQKMTVIEMGFDEYFKSTGIIQFSVSKQPVFHKNFDLLGENLLEFHNKGYDLYILSNNEKQIDRLQAIFHDTGLRIKFTPIVFTLHEGFIDNDLQACFYTDHQIFERYHRYNLRTRREQRASITLKELNKLHPGDYVVHIDHGIGKFAGLVRTEINGKMQEVIRLVYQDNDSLLVSIHSLHRVSKFKGKEGVEPSLNKLGSGAWERMKSRTKAKVKDIARELIALYARRKAEEGFAFSPDSYLQAELEASFIYEDTPDQQKATIAVKEDMEKPIPMDRLVCGDVGFGKTEVAIRAAFKAVADSKQVAVLVPTTVLALQHYKTFSERLADFPANVSYISRLRNPAEIKKSLKEVEEGKVDIIIGTHRLVSEDVKFKDLGLLIVDEEQKFGVSVKEKLKQLKISVDTLALTATPIPRTLQFSLMGARDLSVIQTPPPNRYPILTEVHGFSESLIRDAILFEIQRGGQVFFIHNRIQNIYDVEATLKKMLPGIKTVVGHGQMEGKKLEKVMLDFISGEFDILISTAIIESGLDIPNANTMIINQAQNFGLSDLHQLRGRVGRSNKKAFCYLITPPLSTLTPEARKRLKTIEEFADLGSGFHIAMQDLDIRGAGNLLGAEQSGFISDIGFETYHRILNEAIQELKLEEFHDVFEKDKNDQTNAFFELKYVEDCQIDTDLELLFPSDYIPGDAERMLLYRELDSIGSEEELKKFGENLVDRFGELPEESRELLEVVNLRRKAIDLGIERITLKSNMMICYFVTDQDSPFYHSPVFGKILQFIQSHPKNCRMKESAKKLTLTFANVRTVSEGSQLLGSL